MKKILATLLFSSLLIVGCAERPGVNEATEYLRKNHPEYTNPVITLNEDEVTCRTFLVKHKNENGNSTHSYLQYFDETDEPYWAISSYKPIRNPK